MIEEIRGELARVGAQGVSIALDDSFEPDAGTLVKTELDKAYWHIAPGELQALLEELPEGAGNEAIRRAIEGKATNVWHGPAPEDSEGVFKLQFRLRSRANVRLYVGLHRRILLDSPASHSLIRPLARNLGPGSEFEDTFSRDTSP